MRIIRILCLVAVLGLSLGGGLWLCRFIKGRAPGDEEDDDEFEDLDVDYTAACSQLTYSAKTIQGYWNCLEANAYFLTSDSIPDVGKKGTEGVDNPFNLKSWQVPKPNQEWKKPPDKGKKAMRRTKRVKRASGRQSFTPGAYKSTYTNWTLKARPYIPKPIIDLPPGTYNDLFYNYNHDLYTFDPANLSQKQPPWSYNGELAQQNWHNLELEKFFVPVDGKLGTGLTKLLHASLGDQWTEGNWDPLFSNWLKLIAADIFGKRNAVPPYARDPPEDEPLSLIPNDPNLGYYSSFRFHLPPPPPFNDLINFNERSLLPSDFKMPEEPSNIRFTHPFEEVYKNVLRIRRGEHISPEDLSKLFLYFDVLQLYLRPQRPLDFGQIADEAFLNMTNQTRQWDMDKDRHLEERSQLSLPLLPRPYPICQLEEPSPIDILDEYSTISSIRPYEFGKNFYKMYRTRMFFPDDGTNILGVALENSNPLIGRAVGVTGGATGGVRLYFEQMFIHVGKTESTGTEHKLQGKGYAMELQMLFTYRGRDRDESQPYYKTLARQQNDLFPFRGKIALMMAVLVEVKPDNEVRNKFLFEPLTQMAYKFREQKERGGKNRSRAFTTSQYVFRLSDFIPSDAEFYTYRGGLTFPPCFGYVTWSVYNTTLHITKSQFREFQFLPSIGEDSEYFAGNVREIDSEWVEAENVDGIPPAEKSRLQNIRNRRTLLKSLDPKLYGVNGNESHYDYYYDYDEASSPYISKILIALLPTTVITLFYN